MGLFGGKKNNKINKKSLKNRHKIILLQFNKFNNIHSMYTVDKIKLNKILNK